MIHLFDTAPKNDDQAKAFFDAMGPDGLISCLMARACQKFPLGEVYITAGALVSIPTPFLHLALARHRVGDWGDVCAEDAALNEQALQEGDRLLSVYNIKPTSTKFYILTEHNRSATTVMLPEEY